MMLDELFQAIRHACPTPKWNHGTELARNDAVSIESESDDEIILRVRVPARAASPAVRLYPEDEDWDCDCPIEHGACEHVAASIIALRNAKQNGEELPSATAHCARVQYRLERCEPTLSVRRELIQDGQENAALNFSLQDLAARKIRGPQVLITPADLAAERILTPPKRGALPVETLHALLRILGEARVTLDGESVVVSDRPVMPRARVVDHPKDGFILRFLPDKAVQEVICMGVVRCKNVLRPIGETKLSGERMERLPFARLFRGDDIPKLVQKTIPGLMQRIRVDVQTDALPSISRTLRPRLRFEILRRGDTLDILPEIVYGRPPCARVEQGKLLHLRGKLPRRDEEDEVRIELKLKERYNLIPNRRIYVHGADAADLVEKLRSFKGDIDGFDPRPQRSATLVPRIQVSDEHVQIDFIVPTEDAPDASTPPSYANAAEVLNAWRDGKHQVALQDGGFAPIPRSWLETHGNALAGVVDASKSGRTANTKRPLNELSTLETLELGRLCEALNEVTPPRFEKLRPLLRDFRGISRAKLPEGFTAQLRDYQQSGVDWLCFVQSIEMGALLADDMGLGKTVQTLAATRGKTLVVCPTSVIPNWITQAKQFHPNRSLQSYHGSQRQFDPDASLTVTSYALLRQEIERFQQIEWDCVVLDEAQAIKNPQSQTSQAAFALRSRFRLALTGTPVENRLDELWSIMHFCNPGLLGGRQSFEKAFATPITQGNQSAAIQLHEKIRPFTLRRKKSEVAKDLPPRSEAILYCELTPSERQLYDALKDDSFARTRAQIQQSSVEQSGSKTASTFQILEQLLRLRQAACHPGLVPGQDVHRSSKVERLIEALETAAADGHRALVFSQWTSLLDFVAPRLDAAHLDYLRIDGSTQNRGAIVDSFQREDGPPVLLLSLKAGGTGLNLTAADHVFILDPWWNPAAEAQAADRAHRIGQDKPVFVYRIVAKDTVEEKIIALQDKKRQLAATAIEGAAVDASLSRDDLLSLLEG